MPRVVYCIHALSTHLFRLGKTPAMGDLYGKAFFTSKIYLSANENKSIDSFIFFQANKLML